MILPHTGIGLGASRPFSATLVVALGAAAIGCQPAAAPPLEWNDSVVQAIDAWRAGHEESYTRNWATIEGLHFLRLGPQSAGSAPGNDVVLIASLPAHLGRFRVASDQVTFEPAPGAPITINGETPTSAVVLRDDGAEEPSVIESNGASVVVHRSGARLSLRVRDPNGERAKAFQGASSGFRSAVTTESSAAS